MKNGAIKCIRFAAVAMAAGALLACGVSDAPDSVDDVFDVWIPAPGVESPLVHHGSYYVPIPQSKCITSPCREQKYYHGYATRVVGELPRGLSARTDAEGRVLLSATELFDDLELEVVMRWDVYHDTHATVRLRSVPQENVLLDICTEGSQFLAGESVTTSAYFEDEQGRRHVTSQGLQFNGPIEVQRQRIGPEYLDYLLVDFVGAGEIQLGNSRGNVVELGQTSVHVETEDRSEGGQPATMVIYYLDHADGKICFGDETEEQRIHDESAVRVAGSGCRIVSDVVDDEFGIVERPIFDAKNCRSTLPCSVLVYGQAGSRCSLAFHVGDAYTQTEVLAGW